MSISIPSFTPTSIHALKDLVDRNPGQRLPGERDLAKTLRVSRPALRLMLKELEAQGLVIRRHGSGTYASDRKAGKLTRMAVLIDAGLKLGEDPFFSFVSEMVMKKAQELGIRSTAERITENSGPYQLEDGAVAMGLAARKVLEQAMHGGAPVVALFMPEEVKPGTRASVFQLEDFDGGMLAARYLLDRGSSRLFFYGRSSIPAAHARMEGAKCVAARHNVTLEVVQCGMNYAAGLEAAKSFEWLEGSERIGVIAANDWLAVGLQSGLAARGPRWTRRIHLASFDGLPLAAHPSFGIASFAVPLETITSDVCEELSRLAKNPAAPGRTLKYAFLLPK